MAKYALCIGINNYPGTHMDLRGCVNDAEDWSAELASRGFEVTQLIDAAATKVAMVGGIRDVIGGAADGDLVGSTNRPLGPRQRISRNLVELVPGTREQAGGYIVVQSPIPIVGQEIFVTEDLRLQSAVPPTVIQ